MSTHPTDATRVANAGLLERAQGALLGQLAGDALGSMVEFLDARTIARAHPKGLREIAGSPRWNTIAGQPTDDSEMSLALARSLADGRFDGEAIAASYGAGWRRGRSTSVRPRGAASREIPTS